MTIYEETVTILKKVKLQVKMPFVEGVMDLLENEDDLQTFYDWLVHKKLLNHDEIMDKALYLNIKRYEPWRIIEDGTNRLTVLEQK